MVRSFLDKIGKGLIKHQVGRKSLPFFDDSEEIRNHIIFDGDVQGVGFRYEVSQVAQRLGLTGWIKNLRDSTVEAEIQGEKDKVEYLLDFMNHHDRIRVTNMEVKEIETKESETEFKVVY